MNKEGRFILILDGFDEMTTNVDPLIVFRYLDEVLSLQQASAKVLLTCRTSFFKDRADLDKLKPSSDLESLLHRHHGFKVITIRGLSSTQIQTYLSRYYESEWVTFFQELEARPGLRSLAERPILLKMIVSTIHSPSALASLNVTELYQRYTEIWIRRDNWRCHLTPEQRSRISEVLAWTLLTKARPMIHHVELGAEVSRFFGEALPGHLLEQYAHEVRTCSFLKNDFGGNFSFVHKSFAEFFAARFLLQKISSAEYQLVDRPVTLETIQFLADMVSRQSEFYLSRIWALLRPVDDQRPRPYLRSVAFLVLFMSGAKLSDQDLTGIDVPNGADFSNAHFEDAELRSIRAVGARWKGANLRRARLAESVLSDGTFERAVLEGADLRGARLDHCTLAGADIRNADLRNAVVSEVVLTPHDVRECIKKAQKEVLTKTKKAINAADDFCHLLARNLNVQYKTRFKPVMQDVRQSLDADEEESVISQLPTLIATMRQAVSEVLERRSCELCALEGRVSQVNRLPTVILEDLELRTHERSLRSRNFKEVSELFADQCSSDGDFLNRVLRYRRRLQLEHRQILLRSEFLVKEIESFREKWRCAGPVHLLPLLEDRDKGTEGARFAGAVGLSDQQAEWLVRNGASIKE